MKETIANNENYLTKMEHGSSLESVPEELRTQLLCLVAVKKLGTELQFVPEDKKTAEICREAFAQNIAAYRYIPDKFKTEQMALRIVNAWGSWLKYVPKAHRTYNVCLLAMQKKGDLEEVPEEILSMQIIRTSIQNNAKNAKMALYMNIDEIKQRNLPEVDIKEIVEDLDDRIYLNVPFSEKDEVKALGAYWNGSKRRWVMRKDSDPNLFRRWLPKEYFENLEENHLEDKNELSLFLCVLANPISLREIPEEKRSLAICEAAVRKNVVALRYVPIDEEHMSVFMTAVLERKIAKGRLPAQVQQACQLVERLYNESLHFSDVSEKEKTPAICYFAVRKDPFNIRFVPQYFKDMHGNLLELHEMVKVYHSDKVKKYLQNKSNPSEFPKLLTFARKKLNDMVMHTLPTHKGQSNPNVFFEIISNLQKEIEDCYKRGYSMQQITDALKDVY